MKVKKYDPINCKVKDRTITDEMTSRTQHFHAFTVPLAMAKATFCTVTVSPTV